MNIKTIVNDQSLPDLGYVAVELIKKFAAVNKLNFNLNVIYDFTIEEYGCYYPENDPKSIYVNPQRCLENGNNSIGYVDDTTLFGIIIHEFAHYMTYVVYKKLITDYKKQFPTERLVLGEYCNNDIEDEIAEAIVLYIENPYLFKMIEPKFYKFYKNYFKSPAPCSSKHCNALYMNFTSEMKKNIKTKWGFSWDYNLNKFVLES